MGAGTLYCAPFGSTEPAATHAALIDAPSTPWVDLGGTNGGVTVTIAQTFTAMPVDQIVGRVESRLTDEEITVATSLSEITLQNLQVVLNGGTITAGTSGAPDVFEPALAASSAASPAYNALIFDGYAPGGLRGRLIVRKVLSTDSVGTSYSKDGETLLPVTFTAHYVSDEVPAYTWLYDNVQS